LAEEAGVGWELRLIADGNERLGAMLEGDEELGLKHGAGFIDYDRAKVESASSVGCGRVERLSFLYAGCKQARPEVKRAGDCTSEHAAGTKDAVHHLPADRAVRVRGVFDLSAGMCFPRP
jgi:hypothetical protein